MTEEQAKEWEIKRADFFNEHINFSFIIILIGIVLPIIFPKISILLGASGIAYALLLAPFLKFRDKERQYNLFQANNASR